MKIFKYELVPFKGSVNLPKGAHILSVAFQGDGLFLWALVDPSQAEQTRQFYKIGTGWDIDEPIENCQFLGTVFKDCYVWHIFLEELAQ